MQCLIECVAAGLHTLLLLPTSVGTALSNITCKTNTYYEVCKYN